MVDGLEIGFILDRRWHLMRGQPIVTKREALVAVCRVLNEARVPYAIIGGVALQVHHPDPRTTVDVDLAVLSREAIPAQALVVAGFEKTGEFEHSENWRFRDGTPVQFTDDPPLAAAVDGAGEVELDGVTLRVMGIVDLLRGKIRSGTDPQRRRSKQLQDLSDVEALLEVQPELADALTAEERGVLDRLRQ